MSGKTKLDIEANKRDQYKCIDCGSKGTQTHHIIPELEELNNLVTLCHACHKKRHGMSGCYHKGDNKKRGGLDTRFTTNNNPNKNGLLNERKQRNSKGQFIN